MELLHNSKGKSSSRFERRWRLMNIEFVGNFEIVVCRMIQQLGLGYSFSDHWWSDIGRKMFSEELDLRLVTSSRNLAFSSSKALNFCLEFVTCFFNDMFC